MLTTRPSDTSPRLLAREIAEVRAERERITHRHRHAANDEERADATEGLRFAAAYLSRLEEALEASDHGWERRITNTSHVLNEGVSNGLG